MQTRTLLSAIALLAPQIARAQPSSPDTATGLDHPVPAVEQALEVSVSTGYIQGRGAGNNNRYGYVQEPRGGGTAELGVSYRVRPQLGVGAYGSFALYRHLDANAGIDALALSAGIQATWHFRPARSFDPWLALSTGWSGLWFYDGERYSISRHGVDIARLQLGVDCRPSSGIAIAPVIGGSISVFNEDVMNTDFTFRNHNEAIFTGFIGVAGRFDIVARTAN